MKFIIVEAVPTSMSGLMAREARSAIKAETARGMFCLAYLTSHWEGNRLACTACSSWPALCSSL